MRFTAGTLAAVIALSACAEQEEPKPQPYKPYEPADPKEPSGVYHDDLWTLSRYFADKDIERVRFSYGEHTVWTYVRHHDNDGWKDLEIWVGPKGRPDFPLSGEIPEVQMFDRSKADGFGSIDVLAYTNVVDGKEHYYWATPPGLRYVAFRDLEDVDMTPGQRKTANTIYTRFVSIIAIACKDNTFTLSQDGKILELKRETANDTTLDMFIERMKDHAR